MPPGKRGAPLMTAGLRSGNSWRMVALKSSGNGVSFCRHDKGASSATVPSHRAAEHSSGSSVPQRAACSNPQKRAWHIISADPDSQHVFTFRNSGGLSRSVLNWLRLPLATGLDSAIQLWRGVTQAASWRLCVLPNLCSGPMCTAVENASGLAAQDRQPTPHPCRCSPARCHARRIYNCMPRTISRKCSVHQEQMVKYRSKLMRWAVAAPCTFTG